MAILSNTNYFSNSIVGQPQAGADIDIYQTSLAPKYAVGFGFVRSDGAKFRYAQFSTACTRGTCVAQDPGEAILSNFKLKGATVANLLKKGGETMNPNAVGSRYMQLTLSASAHQFAGGYVVTGSTTGYGFTYRVRDNTTTASEVTGDMHLALYDPIVVAIDSNTDLTVAASPYTGLKTATVTNAAVAGVPLCNNSANSYGWVQTAGPCGVLQDISLPIVGKLVYLSSNTAGAVSAFAASATSTAQLFSIGVCLDPASSTNYSLIRLQLE